jgi:hypothetical protein
MAYFEIENLSAKSGLLLWDEDEKIFIASTSLRQLGHPA